VTEGGTDRRLSTKEKGEICASPRGGWGRWKRRIKRRAAKRGHKGIEPGKKARRKSESPPLECRFPELSSALVGDKEEIGRGGRRGGRGGLASFRKRTGEERVG